MRWHEMKRNNVNARTLHLQYLPSFSWYSVKNIVVSYHLWACSCSIYISSITWSIWLGVSSCSVRCPVWPRGAMVRAVDLTRGSRINLITHLCLYVCKQYKLVPVTQRWCPAAGKVTVGLASHWPYVSLKGSRATEGRGAPSQFHLWSVFFPFSCKTWWLFSCREGWLF